ncbi:MAG: DinB family protein [Anaerolineales bacterium]|nr:DinB family protein [Anaerolineales bacterium]
MSSASPPPTRHIVLLQALHAAPARAAAWLTALPEAGLNWRAAAAAWTGPEIVAHLTAADPLFQQRFQLILTADNPWLPRFGPETARPETHEPLPRLLERFQAGRGQVLRYLSELGPEAWDRPAVHETLGSTTFLAQVQNMVNHDTEHLSQLEQFCHGWENQTRV